jgi:phage shock protein A
MTTPVTKERDLVAEQLAAEVKEAEAKLNVMQAQAQARSAQAEMDEISGLAATKDQVKRNIAKFKERTAADHSIAKGALEKEVRNFQADVNRVRDKYTGWDSARERRFYARLDEAEARLKVWQAQLDQKRVDATVRSQGELAILPQKIAVAKARAAEAKRNKGSAEAQAALEQAAREFDEAYDAAAKQHEKG